MKVEKFHQISDFNKDESTQNEFPETERRINAIETVQKETGLLERIRNLGQTKAGKAARAFILMTSLLGAGGYAQEAFGEEQETITDISCSGESVTRPAREEYAATQQAQRQGIRQDFQEAIYNPDNPNHAQYEKYELKPGVFANALYETGSDTEKAIELARRDIGRVTDQASAQKWVSAYCDTFVATHGDFYERNDLLFRAEEHKIGVDGLQTLSHAGEQLLAMIGDLKHNHLLPDSFTPSGLQAKIDVIHTLQQTVR